MTLARKQVAVNADFLLAWRRIESLVSRDHVERRVDEARDRVLAYCRSHGIKSVDDVGYAWSGGKDSQALRAVMDAAGIERAVLGMTNLEYPAMLRWVTDNMPPELDVVNTGQDLAWLHAHQDMLFPRDARVAGRWFKSVQHKAQETFVERSRVKAICLGRRRLDGNYLGKLDPSGLYAYANKSGLVRLSPIWDWSHEECLAAMHYLGYGFAPVYNWPNGFIVGTGPWPARQWTRGTRDGWRQVYAIDPSVVVEAAEVIPSAARYLESL